MCNGIAAAEKPPNASDAASTNASTRTRRERATRVRRKMGLAKECITDENGTRIEALHANAPSLRTSPIRHAYPSWTRHRLA
jgi:hypothetical protein